MRASRLLSILITLQARGHATAQSLADDCEVSVRTIYRDVEALSAAGVPVYAERGAAGGYRLVAGYRTYLNGLSAQEVEALFLSGLSGPAAALGLEAAMDSAQLKVSASLPAHLRIVADRMRSRFHLDAPGWFQAEEAPDHLKSLSSAVWDQRRVSIRYRSWKGHKQRVVAPLGLVLKSGAWYLAGGVGDDVRTYRVSRIVELEVLPDVFERPAGFDLARYWTESTRRMEADLHPNQAVVRLTPMGFKMLEAFISPYARAHMEVGDADGAGNRVVVFPVGRPWLACSDLLRFGTDAEVIGPESLRAEMRGRLSAMFSAYDRPPGAE